MKWVGWSDTLLAQKIWLDLPLNSLVLMFMFIRCDTDYCKKKKERGGGGQQLYGGGIEWMR